MELEYSQRIRKVREFGKLLGFNDEDFLNNFGVDVTSLRMDDLDGLEADRRELEYLFSYFWPTDSAVVKHFGWLVDNCSTALAFNAWAGMLHTKRNPSLSYDCLRSRLNNMLNAQKSKPTT